MKGKKLVLHAGTHKTGSSSIQNYLYETRDQLPCNYLYRDRPNSSLWLLKAFKKNLSDLPIFAQSGLSQSQVETARAQAIDSLVSNIERSDSEVDILSAESIATLSLEETQALGAFLYDYYSDIQLHVYFRPMKSRVESAFQERLKTRLATLEDKFSLDYRRRVQILDQVFGQESVHVHRYASEDFPGGDVVRHFLKCLQINHISSRKVYSNSSLSFPAIQLLYIYRKHFPDATKNAQSIVRHLTALDGSPLRFHSNLYKKLLVTDYRAVEEFEKRVGFSISEDISKHDDACVRYESDLLAIPDNTLNWLYDRVGSRVPAVFRRRGEKAIAMKVRTLGAMALT